MLENEQIESETQSANILLKNSDYFHGTIS